MQVDQATLDRYVGGEIEIQNQREGYIYRGEVSEVVLNGEELRFVLAWMAKGVGYPPIPVGWVRSHRLWWDVNLVLREISNIGDDRLCFSSFDSKDITVLFPPHGSKLDQSLIEDDSRDS